jgi:glycosyltransferase involved in cell wall biosynthesis
MKISYAVTVCNEFIEIQRLIPFLLEHKRPQDEMVVQMDLNLDDLKNQPQDKSDVFAYIMKHNTNGLLRVIFYPLRGDFAAFKNHLTKQCTGDYIFQIDADELPTESLIQILPDILEKNNGVDLIWVPRVNTVYGLTAEHIKRWGWAVNGSGWVNWPDWQGRIYKNHPSVCWENPVHEKLGGIRTFANLPADVSFALHHPKTIERQVKQNEYYETL